MDPKDKISLAFGIPIILIAGGFAFLALTNIDVKGEEEWSNNATLIAEIGVGIVVALVVLMIAKLNEIKIEKKLSFLEISIIDDKMHRWLQRYRVVDELITVMSRYNQQVREYFTELPKRNEDDNVHLQDEIESTSTILTSSRFENDDYFSHEDIKEIKEIIAMGKVVYRGEYVPAIDEKIHNFLNSMIDLKNEINSDIRHQTRLNEAL